MRLLPPTDTCRAIDGMRLPWPYTRSIWRRNPIFRREPTPAQAERGECGTVNHCAIDVLEDIIGWYRIKRTRDEATGQIVSESRLFDGETLQKDYAAWGHDMGYTKRQMQDAIALLHNAGLSYRWCETRLTDYGVKIGNAVFIEPCPDAIRALSRPAVAQGGDTPPLPSVRERGPAQTGEGSRREARGIPPKRETPKSLNSASKPQANPQQRQETEPPVVSVSSKVKEEDEFFESGEQEEGNDDNAPASTQAETEDEGDPAPTQVAPSTQPLPQEAEGSPTPSPQELLLAELVAEGMGEVQAKMAVRNYYDRTVHQLENLRRALPEEKLIPDDRGKWLHVAIRDGYGPTKGFTKFLAAQKIAKKRQENQARIEAAQQAKVLAERAVADDAKAELTPEAEAALRQRARNCVHPDWRKKGEAKCALMIDVNYQTLLKGEEMKEHCFWPVSKSTDTVPKCPQPD